MRERLERIGVIVMIVVLVFFTGCASSYNTNSTIRFEKVKGNSQYAIDKSKKPTIAKRFGKQNSKNYKDGTKKPRKAKSSATIIYPWDCPGF